MAIFHSSLWLSNIPLYTFLIHSFFDGHLGCFHILAIVNDATMNTGVHVSFQINVFVLFEKISRSGIARSYGSSVFNFLRKLYTVSIVAAPIYSDQFPLYMSIWFWYQIMLALQNKLKSSSFSSTFYNTFVKLAIFLP